MDLKDLTKDIRKKILEIKYKSKEEHIGSALSLVDILTVLYFKILNINPKDPKDTNRDRLVLSKGHAAAALYVVLAKKGFFDEEMLDQYCVDGSKIAGHSTLNSLPGIEVTAGSLGHGLPMATGIALAGKIDKKNYRVFAVLSDGEMDEGTTWEAALFASHHKLDNLTIIIDYNKWQAFGRTNEVLNLEPLAKKWEAFGFSVHEVDGHNLKDLEKTFSKIPFKKDKPNIVICHTIKGKGVSILEDRLESHYVHLSEEEFKKAIEELK